LQSVEWCAKESKEPAEGLRVLQETYRDKFRSARSSALLQTLIDKLFDTPATTIGDAAALLHVSQATASANIKKLEAAGVLREITGNRKSRLYLADEILAFSSAASRTTPPSAEGVTRTVPPEFPKKLT
jgi:hypothetical protein